MTDAEFDAAIAALSPWVGRTRIVEDEIGLSSARRIAGMLDMDSASITQGMALPPHWFSMFFPDIAKQSDIGPDGHPHKGVFLPPIPLPRRMGAGRRVTINGQLVVGEPAIKKAEVAAIIPKHGRTGRMAVLTTLVRLLELKILEMEGGEQGAAEPHLYCTVCMRVARSQVWRLCWLVLLLLLLLPLQSSLSFPLPPLLQAPGCSSTTSSFWGVRAAR